MRKRVALSGDNQQLAEIANLREDVHAALQLYFSPDNPEYPVRFFGYSTAEISAELMARKAEVDRQAIFSILSAIEAAFRVDYERRCKMRQRDPISRAFRQLDKEKGSFVSLDENILEIWKQNTTSLSKTIGEIRSSLHLRHWLAHGRFWVPKLGKKYDYVSVYTLGSQIFNSFPFVGF